MVLGTESELSFQYNYGNENVIDDFKTSPRAKRKRLEGEGKMDRWSSMQQNIMPTIDEFLLGSKSKFCLNTRMMMALGTLIGAMLLLIL